MASRINTRFILGFTLAVGAALMVFGGVYVLKIRGDATRNYRKGTELFARGEFKQAYDQFGRALAKEPGNAEYLERMSESLHRIVPQTGTEAAEYFTRSMAVLGHAALHNPRDVQAHMTLLKSLTEVARLVNDPRSWEAVIAAADAMHLQVPDGEPLKPLARSYRALAVSRLVATRNDEEVQAAIEQAQQAAAMLGDNDFACAVKIAIQSAWVQKLETAGRSRTTVDAERAELSRIARQAIQQAPNGPETARAWLLYLAMERFADTAQQGVTGERQVTDEDIRTAIDHVASVVTPTSDPALVLETVSLLQALPFDARSKAKTLLRNAIEARPQQYDYHARLARLHFENDELADAQALAQTILNAPLMPVGWMSRVLFGLRIDAASLLGDVAYRRWETAAPAARAAALAEVVKARDVLAALSPNPDSDAIVQRADAKIAYAREDFVTAAQKFEQLVAVTNARDPEMLAFASASLQRIGQIGAAHERISQALALNPQAIGWAISKANLELRMAQPEEALRTLNTIPAAALEANPNLLTTVNAIRRQAAAGGAAIDGAAGAGGISASDAADPVMVAMRSAEESLEKNEHDNARAALLAALGQHPPTADDVRLLSGLAVVELRAGDRDASRRYIEQGLALQPNNPALHQFMAALQFEDPIQATVEYHRTAIEDETQRHVATLVALGNFVAQQLTLAEQRTLMGDPAGAAAARELASRAEAEAERAAAQLEQRSPENTALIEYRFGRALANRDYTLAEALAQTARRLNSDAAGGLLFEGRLRLAQRNIPAAITALESATDRLSFSAYAWRMLAVAYQQAGNFAQAERAYERAYRCNPNDVTSAKAYGVLLQQRGDQTRALAVLRAIHRLVPNDAAIREAWLDLEAAAGNVAMALSEREEQYRLNPRDVNNASSLALLLVSIEPDLSTLLDERGQPRFSPQRWAGMSNAEKQDIQRQARDQWNTRADRIVEQVASELGDTLRVAALRAAIARERGDPAAGEKALREFMARRNANNSPLGSDGETMEDMYLELGRHFALTGRSNDAVSSLRQAVALNGPKLRESREQLARLLMQLQQYSEALEVMQTMKAAAGSEGVDRQLQLHIAECLINLNRLDEAQSQLNELTAADGGSVVTLLLASIAQRRGLQAIVDRDMTAAERHFASNRDLLMKAEQQDPANPLPRILLAQSLIDEYNRTQRPSLLNDALLALDRAEDLRPGMAQVSALRVSIFRERGELSSAVAELQRVLAANPNDVGTRRQLVMMLVETGAFTAAMDTLDAGIRLNPTIAAWHELRGDLLAARAGNAAGAGATGAAVVSAYAQAFEHSPSSAMLRKLTHAMLLLERPDCAGVIARLEARTDLMDIEPALRDHYVRALACVGRRDQALEQLRASYRQYKAGWDATGGEPPVVGAWASWFIALATLYPGDQAAEGERLLNELAGGSLKAFELNGLARLWLGAGQAGFSRAMELARQAVAQCPPQRLDMLAQFNSDLGDLLVGSGDVQGAKEAYEAAVRANPRAWTAVNNLAYLKAEVLGDAAGALPLAERLAEGAGDQGSVLDTVGWVYFKNGDLEKAVRYLRQSVAILPAPDTYIHLAEVLWRQGDLTEAEKQLQEAEKLNPSAESQQKIRSLRVDMRNN